MTAVSKFKKGRGHYGYLPNPDNPEESFSWMRATDFIDVIEDKGALEFWKRKMVAKGIALREDLYAKAAATDIEDNKSWYRVCTQAMEAAGAGVKANLGDALHDFTESHDKKQTPVVPFQWKVNIEAYQNALDANGITIDPAHIEKTVVHKDQPSLAGTFVDSFGPDKGVAGTFDRILRLSTGELVIGDLKTAGDRDKFLSYGWLKHSEQLGTYANAKLMWNPEAQKYEPLPDVSKEFGIIIHLPVGGSTCELWKVRIDVGWKAVRDVVSKIRSLRDLAFDDLAEPLAVGQATLKGTDMEIEESLFLATSVQELGAIWRAAKQTGLWKDQHTKLAAELKKKFL